MDSKVEFKKPIGWRCLGIGEVVTADDMVSTLFPVGGWRYPDYIELNMVAFKSGVLYGYAGGQWVYAIRKMRLKALSKVIK